MVSVRLLSSSGTSKPQLIMLKRYNNSISIFLEQMWTNNTVPTYDTRNVCKFHTGPFAMGSCKMSIMAKLTWFYDHFSFTTPSNIAEVPPVPKRIYFRVQPNIFKLSTSYFSSKQ